MSKLGGAGQGHGPDRPRHVRVPLRTLAPAGPGQEDQAPDQVSAGDGKFLGDVAA